MRAIALGLLLAVACDKGGPSREELARQKAEAEAAQAIKDATEAKAKLDNQIKQLDELDTKIVAAVDRVADAQTDSQRAAAQAELKALQEQKAELKRSIAAAHATHVPEREKGVKISIQCYDNPLAKGCN